MRLEGPTALVVNVCLKGNVSIAPGDRLELGIGHHKVDALLPFQWSQGRICNGLHVCLLSKSSLTLQINVRWAWGVCSDPLVLGLVVASLWSGAKISFVKWSPSALNHIFYNRKVAIMHKLVDNNKTLLPVKRKRQRFEHKLETILFGVSIPM